LWPKPSQTGGDGATGAGAGFGAGFFFFFASVALCVPKIRFCSIDDEGRQGQVVM